MAVPSRVKHDSFAWFDAALSQPIPPETDAFHVSLYEGKQ